MCAAGSTAEIGDLYDSLDKNLNKVYNISIKLISGNFGTIRVKTDR